MDIKERYLRNLAEKSLPFFKKAGIPAEFLTLFRIVFALFVAFFLIRGYSLLSAALLFAYQFILLLDYIDGKLARYQKKFSLKWVEIDFLSHYVVSFLFLFVLALSLSDSNIYLFYAGLLGSLFILILTAIGIRNFKAIRIQKKSNKGRLSSIYSFIGIDNPFNLFFILFLFNLIPLLITFYFLFYLLALFLKIIQ